VNLLAGWGKGDDSGKVWVENIFVAWPDRSVRATNCSLHAPVT
jgi:hypothetical protein